jgi:hypothetical protein
MRVGLQALGEWFEALCDGFEALGQGFEARITSFTHF